jgi:hypothetical protein
MKSTLKAKVFSAAAFLAVAGVCSTSQAVLIDDFGSSAGDLIGRVAPNGQTWVGNNDNFKIVVDPTDPTNYVARIASPAAALTSAAINFNGTGGLATGQTWAVTFRMMTAINNATFGAVISDDAAITGNPNKTAEIAMRYNAFSTPPGHFFQARDNSGGSQDSVYTDLVPQTPNVWYNITVILDLGDPTNPQPDNTYQVYYQIGNDPVAQLISTGNPTPGDLTFRERGSGAFPLFALVTGVEQVAPGNTGYIDDIHVNVVPEPAAMGLAGCVGLLALGRRSRRS